MSISDWWNDKDDYVAFFREEGHSKADAESFATVAIAVGIEEEDINALYMMSRDQDFIDYIYEGYEAGRREGFFGGGGDWWRNYRDADLTRQRAGRQIRPSLSEVLKLDETAREFTRYGFSPSAAKAASRKFPDSDPRDIRDFADQAYRAYEQSDERGSSGFPSFVKEYVRTTQSETEDGEEIDISDATETNREIDEGRPDVTTEEKNRERVTGEAPTSAKRQDLTSEALDAARKTFDKSFELYDDQVERAEDFERLSNQERRRRLGLEDEALEEAERSAARVDEDRRRYLEDYELAREDARFDRDARKGLIEELRNAPSTYEEAQRQGHEQTLKNQAALAAVLPTRAGGSAVRSILDQQKELDLNVAQASSVGRLQEIAGRRNLMAQLLSQNQAGALEQQKLALTQGAQGLEFGKQDLVRSNLKLGVAGSAARGEQLAQSNYLESLGLGFSALTGSQTGASMAGKGSLALSQFLSSEEEKEHARFMRLLGAGAAGIGGLAQIALGIGTGNPLLVGTGVGTAAGAVGGASGGGSGGGK